MSDYYSRQGEPITFEEWAGLRVSQGSWEHARRVAATQIGEAWVSTVWLGLDHSFGYGPPLIFETMIFGGSFDQGQWRYSTEAEAIAGHVAVVGALTSGAPLPD